MIEPGLGRSLWREGCRVLAASFGVGLVTATLLSVLLVLLPTLH